MGCTYKEEDSGVVAKRVNVALSGRVGFVNATPATTPPSIVVETTCSAATAPAAISMIELVCSITGLSRERCLGDGCKNYE